MFKRFITTQEKKWWPLIVVIHAILNGCDNCFGSKNNRNNSDKSIIFNKITPCAISATFIRHSNRHSNNKQRNTASNRTNSFSPHIYSSFRSSKNSSPPFVSGSFSASFSNDRFSSVSYKSPRVAAPTAFAGLTNVGNSCYMNAVFQIVAALYKEKVQRNPLKNLINKINDGTKPLSNQVMLDFRQKIFNEIEGFYLPNEQQDVHEFITRLNVSYRFLDPINFATRTIIKASFLKKNRPVFLQKERKEPEEPILFVSFRQERSDSNQTSDLSKMIALNNEEFVKDKLEVNRREYSELEGSTNESNFFGIANML